MARRGFRTWASCALLLTLWSPGFPAQGSNPSGLYRYQPDLFDDIYQWRDATFPGTYRKEPDGSFRRVESTRGAGLTRWVPVPSVRPVPAADVDAYVRAMGAAFGPGGDRRRPNAPAQSSPLLEPFIPGGVVKQSQLPPAKGKNLLVVLSPGSQASFAAIDDMQRQVAAWAATQKLPEVRTLAEAVMRLPLKASFASTLADTVRPTFRRMTFAANLSAFDTTIYDYALIVDVGFAHDMAAYLAGAGSKTPRPHQGLTRHHLSWILIDHSRDVAASSFKVDQSDQNSVDDPQYALKELIDKTKSQFGADGMLELKAQLMYWPPPSTLVTEPAPAGPPKFAAGSAPPLLPGEVAVQTLGGCSVVMDMSTSTPFERERVIQSVRELMYYPKKSEGGCVNGLASGTGFLMRPSDFARRRAGEDFFGEYAFGRALGKSRSSAPPASVSYFFDHQFVMLSQSPDPYAAVWGDTPTMLFSPGGATAMTTSTSCYTDEKRFAGCKDRAFDVFGVTITDRESPTGATNWCPNPKSPNGCQALWQQKAGRIIASMKAVVAYAEQDFARRKAQYAALDAEWRAARAAALKDQEARAKIEFALRLERAPNAGALFALADRMSAAKRPVESRQALVALVSRYKTHPLGVVAAKRLAALAK